MPMKKHLIPLIILVLLISACVSQGSTATTKNQPTETPAVQQPTDTPTSQLPTDTPTSQPPSETPTPLPPTDTPEPTATATIASTPTPDIPREQVEVPYEDRVIRGTLLGDGDIVVVLAPMWGLDRSSWMPFAKHVASLGYSALAFDFPGVGTSTGSFSFSATIPDALAVIDFLRERGYERIVCIGASMGADGCFGAGLLRPEMAGLVIIAGPPTTTAEEAATLLMPKLYLVGNEPDVKDEMNESYKLLPMPKEFKTINAKAHGTDLLHTDAADEFNEILVDFLESVR
jgi:alpha/beta superfamily hydrolase